MSKDRKALGVRGEDLAVELLQENGCTILARNYRWGRSEIDIIAAGATRWHFVEVKTRHWHDKGDVLLEMRKRQRDLIIGTAGKFIDDHDYRGDFQFDLVTVLFDQAGNHTTTWHQDCFGFV